MTFETGPLAECEREFSYPLEDLVRVARPLKAGGHLLLAGLPGTGKSTFVRQLISSRVRKRVGLGAEYLVVLLDGHEFVGCSLDLFWGAVNASLHEADRSGRSQFCLRQGVQSLSYSELVHTLRGFRDKRLILILDHCPSRLCEKLDRSVCEQLLRLSRMCPTTLVTIPHPSTAHVCDRVLDQFVPTRSPWLPLEQAKRFLRQATSVFQADLKTEETFVSRVVDWVGGNLGLLDVSRSIILKLGKVPIDVIMLWLSKDGRASLDRSELKEFAQQDLYSEPKWLDHPAFRRVLYELCFLDAQRLYDRWWSVLSKRERLALLAIDEVQRLGLDWPPEVRDLEAKGLLWKRQDRYVIYPRLLNDYVMARDTVFRIGPFRVDLGDLQTVYVGERLCTLSPAQAGIFYRLVAHANQVVPYQGLYADLYAPYEERPQHNHHNPGYLTRKIVDLEIDELCKVLGVKMGMIERVPDNGASGTLEGFRLIVRGGKE